MKKLDSVKQNPEERSRLLREHETTAVDWRPENAWIKKLDVVRDPNSNQDVKIEDFKAHFEKFQTHYCDHFAGVEEVFQSKIQSLNRLKTQLSFIGKVA